MQDLFILIKHFLLLDPYDNSANSRVDFPKFEDENEELVLEISTSSFS